MTKRTFAVLVAIALVAGSIAGLGGLEAAKKAGPTKIGFVDLQRTLNETKVGKKARGRLEGEKAKKQKEIDAAQGDLQEEFQALEKQRTVLKPDVLAKRERALQEKYLKLQQDFVKYQQDLTKKEAELTKEIFLKAATIIEEIAKREGYTVIVEKNEGGLLYADSASDITEEVNKRLDEDKS